MGDDDGRAPALCGASFALALGAMLVAELWLRRDAPAPAPPRVRERATRAARPRRARRLRRSTSICRPTRAWPCSSVRAARARRRSSRPCSACIRGARQPCSSAGAGSTIRSAGSRLPIEAARRSAGCRRSRCCSRTSTSRGTCASAAPRRCVGRARARRRDRGARARAAARAPRRRALGRRARARGARPRAGLGSAGAAARRAARVARPVALRARVLPYLLRVRDALDLPILYITHDPDEALLVGDWVAVLDRGRVVATGEPRAVLWSRAVLPLSEALGLENVIEARVQACADGSARVETRQGLRLVVPAPLPLDAGEPAAPRACRARTCCSRPKRPGASRRATCSRRASRGSSPPRAARSSTSTRGEPLVAKLTHEAVRALELAPGRRGLLRDQGAVAAPAGLNGTREAGAAAPRPLSACAGSSPRAARGARTRAQKRSCERSVGQRQRGQRSGRSRMRPQALRLALAHRAVAHERAQLALRSRACRSDASPRIGRRPPAVAPEAARIAPGAEAPLRPHAALALGTHERGVRHLAEAVVRRRRTRGSGSSPRRSDRRSDGSGSAGRARVRARAGTARPARRAANAPARRRLAPARARRGASRAANARSSASENAPASS